MDIKFSIVINTNNNNLNSLVMRAGYLDENGVLITLKSCVKTDLSLEQSLVDIQEFIDLVNSENNG